LAIAAGQSRLAAATNLSVRVKAGAGLHTYKGRGPGLPRALDATAALYRCVPKPAPPPCITPVQSRPLEHRAAAGRSPIRRLPEQNDTATSSPAPHRSRRTSSPHRRSARAPPTPEPEQATRAPPAAVFRSSPSVSARGEQLPELRFLSFTSCATQLKP
jgi:hypothetical protein